MRRWFRQSQSLAAIRLTVFACLAMMLAACGGSGQQPSEIPATSSPSVSPEATQVLGRCAASLPLVELAAPDIFRSIQIPDDREAVRELCEQIPREIDGKMLQLPFVGPPEIFVAQYGEDGMLVLTAKQLAPGETGRAAIERDVAASSANCEAGRDGRLIWATLTEPEGVQIIWAIADEGWAFSALAPDLTQAEALLATAIGVLVDNATAPPSSSEGCTITGVTLAQISDIAALAWASDQIVVGEVIRAHPTTPDPRAARLPFHTDFDVRVESFVRGQPMEIVTIRQPGGEIPGGCTDRMGQLELATGDRFLLFLDHDERTEFGDAYLVVGDRQGYWRLTDKDTFVELVPHYQEAFERQPLASATTAIRDALRGEMPTRPIGGVAPVVPLDAAPLNPALGE